MKNRRCPACAAVGRDKTGDHLFLMEDGKTWYCNKPYHDVPYWEREGKQLTEEEVESMTGRLSLSEIRRLPKLGNTERGVSQATHEAFLIRTELSMTDRSPVATYYPELTGGEFMSYKMRRFPKDFSIVKGDITGVPDYFGQWRCPKSGKRLLICAGEEDTLAAYQMLKDRYPEQDPCVVGLPRGEGGSMETIAENLEFTKNFDEVILAMDNDEAGRKALATAAPVFGDKVRVLLISENDVGDMLTKNKHKEFINAFYSAKEYRPTNIIGVEDILEKSIQPVEWGYSYPWEKLTRMTYGMKKKGEIIGIGGAPGSGKTTVWQQIQKHLIFEHGEPIAIFDIEEGEVQGLKKLIGSCMNRPIHKPDCEYDIEVAREVGSSFAGKAFFYGGDSENWEEVESAIRYFASKGIRFFFIDPLSALVEHLSPSDGNTELGRIMRAMRKMRKHQGLTFFHSNHLNNPNTGKEHGEGGRVLGSQFSGSRSQWKYSTLVLGFERNQQADTPEERDESVLRVIKDRLGGNTGPMTLKYNRETGNLDEVLLPDLLGER